MATTQSVETVLQSLIGSAPAVATSMVVLAALAGVGMATFASYKVYDATQNGEGQPLGWILAGVCGALLTCVSVIVARASLLLVS